MRPVLSFLIALLGLMGLGWAMYRSRDKDDPKSVLVIAFAMYALIFALGVGYYGEGALSSIKGGTSGVEITMRDAQSKIESTGDRVEKSVVENIKKDVDGLLGEAKSIRDSLQVQAATGKATLEKLMAVESRLADRRVQGNVRDQFVASLRRAGKSTVYAVWTTIGDYEQSILANDLRDSIKAAGWAITDSNSMQLMGLTARGIILYVVDDERLTQNEAVLREAIAKAISQPFIRKATDSRVPMIVVGGKPLR